MRTLAPLLLRCALALGAIVATSLPAVAQEETIDEYEFDAVHHTTDATYLDFAPIGVVELPRIFLVRHADGALGIDAFGSTASALRSGRYVAEAGGGHGPESAAPVEAAHGAADAPHGAAPAGDPAEALVEGGRHLDAHLVPAGGGKVLVDFSITRHLVFIFVAMAILVFLLIPLAGRYRRGVGRTSAPRGRLQNVLEVLVVYVRDEIARPNLGKKTDRYLPYLLTVFFFILLCNLMGLLPWGATATANISVTAVLAFFTFVVTQFAGTKDYWGHIFNPPGVPAFVKPILVPVEVLGLFTKPFALAIRLFANMTAGHLVILNLIGIIFIIGRDFGTGAGFGTSVPATLMALFVYGLEILVAFIQAYVFTILSALFIGMATAEHEHDHDHAEDHGLRPLDVAVAESNGQDVHKLHERTVGTEVAMAA